MKSHLLLHLRPLALQLLLHVHHLAGLAGLADHLHDQEGSIAIEPNANGGSAHCISGMEAEVVAILHRR